jgi:hypothetical protein
MSTVSGSPIDMKPLMVDFVAVLSRSNEGSMRITWLFTSLLHRTTW